VFPRSGSKPCHLCTLAADAYSRTRTESQLCRTKDDALPRCSRPVKALACVRPTFGLWRPCRMRLTLRRKRSEHMRNGFGSWCHCHEHAPNSQGPAMHSHLRIACTIVFSIVGVACDSGSSDSDGLTDARIEQRSSSSSDPHRAADPAGRTPAAVRDSG